MKSLIIISVFVLTAASFSQEMINEHFKTANGSNVVATSSSQPDYFYLGQSKAGVNENSVSIYFSVPAKQNVRIAVIDVYGKEVSLIVNNVISAGTYKTEFDASSLPAGVYFYRLQGDNYLETKKMTII